MLLGSDACARLALVTQDYSFFESFQSWLSDVLRRLRLVHRGSFS